MCAQPNAELEVLATVVHSTGALVNLLGLIFNAKRLPENSTDVIIHGAGFVYHTRAAIGHYQRARDLNLLSGKFCAEEGFNG